MAFVIAGAATIIWAATAPSAAVACSGTALIGDGVRDDPNASAIFSGTAVRVEDPRWFFDPVMSSMDGMRWTFVVDDVERGSVGERVTVQTARSTASCGVAFELGGRFRVVAMDGDRGLWASANPGTQQLPPVPTPPPVEGPALPAHAFPWILVVVAGAMVVGAVAFIRMGRPRAA